MTDYVGSSYDEAVADLMSYNVRITKRLRISPESPGIVVDQEPVGGSPFAMDVTLIVSVAPPLVPDEVNKTYADAVTDLERQGFTVVQVPVFDESLADGLVLGQDPPAGTPNVGEVTLRVARRPIVTFVNELTPVDTFKISDLETGAIASNGVVYDHAYSIRAYDNVTAYVEFNLGRDFLRLVGTVGTTDRSTASDASYRYEILGDGRLLYEGITSLGVSEQMDIDVKDVLRLRISVIGAGGAVVFGDLRLYELQGGS